MSSTVTTTAAPPAAAGEVSHDRAALRAGGVVISHTVVDLFSYVLIPILSVLEGRLSLSPAQGAALLAMGSIASGAIQPLVAWASDRLNTRWLGTIGFALLVVAVGLLGYAQNYWQLMALQIIASAGSGAFHPVAAAGMGALAGRRRSLGVAVFFAAGMVGGILGNAITPHYVKSFGVPALAWWIIPGLVGVAILKLAVHSVPHRAATAQAAHDALNPAERADRWRSVWFLYAGNVLRFTVNTMLVQLLVRWSELEALKRAGASELTRGIRTEASLIGGPLQAAMQVGMGTAGLLASTLLARRQKGALVWIPAIAAIALALFPFAPTPLFAAMVSLAAGAGFGAVLPLTIAMAQRLLPHRTSLASGLMMGGAWGVGAVGPPMAQYITDHWGVGPAFWLSAVLLVVSGALGVFVRPPAD